jgi:hypothetical protein
MLAPVPTAKTEEENERSLEVAEWALSGRLRC